MMESHNKEEIYYCVGEPQEAANFDLNVDKLNEFFPNQPASVRIFKTRADAAVYRLDKKTPRGQNESDYYVPIFEVKLTPDETANFIDSDRDKGADIFFEKIVLLRAEVKFFSQKRHQYEESRRNNLNGYLVTQAGIDAAFLKFKQDNALALATEKIESGYAEVNEKIQALARVTGSLCTHYHESISALALRVLASHTMVLVHSLLEERNHFLSGKVTKKLTLEKMKLELDCIQKGWNLLGEVLNDPSDTNMQALKDFIKNKAPGRTKYWRVWSGALTGAAAIALFATGIALIGPHVAASGGGLLMLLLASAVLSASGREKGVAKQLRYFTELKDDQTASPDAAKTFLGPL